MKLQSLFAYFLLICTSFINAGSENSTSKNLPERPNSAREMLLTTDLSSDQPASSSLVYFGNDGRLVYQPYTDKGDQILDFSVCGYKRSEEPIPNVPVAATVNPLQGETIPDGTMAYPKGPDSRAHIQSAIDKVASRQPDEDGFRGAVLLTKGTFYLEGGLLVPSGVVLRGEGDGPDGTVLIFRNPRGTGIQVGNPEAKPVSMGAPIHITDAYIPTGSLQVNVEDASPFKQGDYIHVRKTTNDKWIQDLGMDRITEIRPDNKRVGNWNARAYQFDHVRQIAQIEGNTITLDEQLPQSITAEHGGGIVEKVSLDEIDTLCGVESLRVVSNYDTSIKSVRNNEEYFSDEVNNLRSGINLSCINGWARDCTVLHTRNAAVMTSNPARYCTVRDCKKLEPVAPILGGRRYPFSFNGGSHSLFYKCYTEEARHAFAAGSRVMGPNAFVECTAWKSSTISEPHHRWSAGLLYDNITLKDGGQLGALNRGYSGSGHGWAGVNIVFWNCNAESIVVFGPPTPEQNFAIGYTGEIREAYSTERLEYANDRSGYVGTPKAGVYKGYPLMGTGYIESPEEPVAPRSLFMQQLIDRIGKERATQVVFNDETTIETADSILLEGQWVKISKKKFEPTLRDVAYGPYERNKLDFWKAESKSPTPLVLYIHGGGWGGGSKEQNEGPHLNLLKNGVSYVSINYRLARGENKLPCSLDDAARALQFVRSKATEWNIDPDRIIATGGSAGGCSSLWLAAHDDLADPKSEDPIERESTRLLAAAVISAQTTIDALMIEERIGSSASSHGMIWKSVGASSRDDLLANWEKYKDLALECSPLTHLSKDDPKVYMSYHNDRPKPILRDGIHHAEFGRLFKEAADAIGVDCTFEIRNPAARQKELDDFMLRTFNEAK